jgi:hypothetical protein
MTISSGATILPCIFIVAPTATINGFMINKNGTNRRNALNRMELWCTLIESNKNIGSFLYNPFFRHSLLGIVFLASGL